MLEKNIKNLDLILFLILQTIELKKELINLRTKLKNKKKVGNEIFIDCTHSTRGRKPKPKHKGYFEIKKDVIIDFS